MSDDQKIFMPSQPLEPGPRYGILSGFEPGTRVLKAGFQIAPPFRSLEVDVVLDKDVAVPLRDGGHRFRKIRQERAPILPSARERCDS